MLKKIDFIGQAILILLSLASLAVGLTMTNGQWFFFMIFSAFVGIWQLLSVIISVAVAFSQKDKVFLKAVKWYGLGILLLIAGGVSLIFIGNSGQKTDTVFPVFLSFSWILALYYCWITYQDAFPKQQPVNGGRLS